MSFVQDTFTDTAGTNLTAHTGETGATWAKETGFVGDLLITDANRARNNSASSGYYASGAPAAADYDVTADFVVKSNLNSTAGICGRMLSSAKTFYVVQYSQSLAQWQLKKSIAGTQTTLGTSAATLTVGQSYALKLKMRGTTIELWIDGAALISATDSAIAAANAAGITDVLAATNTTGYHLDNFLATEPPTGLTYATNPLTLPQNVAMSADNPSLAGGAADSYSAAPALPSGLTLNTVTGQITGTPDTAQAATNYTITATNVAGSTTATLSIEVDAPAKTTTGGSGWLTVERNQRRELLKRLLMHRIRRQ